MIYEIAFYLSKVFFSLSLVSSSRCIAKCVKSWTSVNVDTFQFKWRDEAQICIVWWSESLVLASFYNRWKMKYESTVGKLVSLLENEKFSWLFFLSFYRKFAAMFGAFCDVLVWHGVVCWSWLKKGLGNNRVDVKVGLAEKRNSREFYGCGWTG